MMIKLVQPNSESHFDRDSWIVAIAAASYVAITFILMLIGFRFPSDGWQYDDFSDDRGLLALRNISGNASLLQPGDVVVAVDGQAMQSLKLRPAVTSDVWRTGGTARYTVIRDDQTLEHDVMLKPQPLIYWWDFVTSEGSLINNIVDFASLALASFVFMRRPRNLGARALFLAFAMWLGMNGFFLTHNAVAVHFFPPTYYYLFLFFSLSWIWWLMPSLITFVLVFPLRKGPMRHYARQTLTLLFGLPAALIIAALPLGMEQIYLVTLGVLVVLFLVSTLVSTIHTLWTDRDPIVRAQLGWMILGLVLTVGLPLVWFLLSAWFPNSPLITMLEEVGPVVQIAFPLCAAIAILRYRLFDINIIINRALVYGTLTLLVISLYIFVVGYLGTLFRIENNLSISLLATGLVAVLFQPLRDRLQLGVNRLMYGRRDEPVAVLSQLGERLEATILPEEILPGLAETIAQALKLPYVAVALQVAGQSKVQAEAGSPAPSVEGFPLIYQGQRIGQLSVARRAPGEKFNAADRLLLTNIARQVSAVAHAVQLNIALQQSRQQLVTAREEERRRLRRDLHDGLGPQLASQTLTIDAISKILDRDSAAAKHLLEQLKSQSQAAIQDIRRLVYGLRPPALDELGLVEALRESTRHQDLAGCHIEIATNPDPLPVLPAAVEVAIYRIVQEAITNVLRHAHASQCTVFINMRDNHLEINIADNGIGYPADLHFGVGLNSMRERAEELGGTIRFENQLKEGARVIVLLPLSGEEE